MTDSIGEKIIKGCISFFTGLILTLIPIATLLVIRGYYSESSRILWRAFSDFLNDSNLIYVNMIAASICMLLRLIGFEQVAYYMGAEFDLSGITILLFAFGAFFMMCSYRLKLDVFSKISLFSRRDGRPGLDTKSVIYDAVDAALSVSMFFVCNVIAERIKLSRRPMLWAVMGCGLLVLLLIREKQYAMRFGKDTDKRLSFFASLNILSDLFNAVVTSISIVMFVFFMYYISLVNERYAMLSPTALIVFAIAVIVGLILSLHSMAEDVKEWKRVVYLLSSFVLYSILSSIVSI